MLLDESTSAVDSRSEQRIYTNLKQLFREQTMLVISHRLSALTWVDRIILLSHGTIEDHGPHHALIHRSRLYNQLYATTDPIAERVRKLGGTTVRSIGHIAQLQRISDNDAEYVTPLDMLAELREDNARLGDRMRETHGVCGEHGDVATASLLEVWIDEAERRAWFLFELTRPGETPGR